MGADSYREEDPQGPSIPLSIIQTFRIDQERTANISNSPTSTNHLGPLVRYRVIYRFPRRTNHHDRTILSVNYLFVFKGRSSPSARTDDFVLLDRMTLEASSLVIKKSSYGL